MEFHGFQGRCLDRCERPQEGALLLWTGRKRAFSGAGWAVDRADGMAWPWHMAPLSASSVVLLLAAPGRQEGGPGPSQLLLPGPS